MNYTRAQHRAYQVQGIVKKTLGTSCIWTGIPLWESAPTESSDMIRRESAPRRFFDTSPLTARITRQEDKRHPDTEGGRLWANEFWKWFEEQRDTQAGPVAIKPAPPEEHALRPAPDPWGKNGTRVEGTE